MTMSNPLPLFAGGTFKHVPAAEVQVSKLASSPVWSANGIPDQSLSEPLAPPPNTYHRYHIETRTAPDIVPLPSRFRVKVKKHRLIAMVLKELFEVKGNFQVALSRPCVYGVFSRPVGGLAPREELCVGCLRCAGYRGLFGGEGWDGLWTDMSEIVRPTRDGIHGREFISTAVDIGEKPTFLHFDDRGEVVGPVPTMITTQVPFFFDVPAYTTSPEPLLQIFTEAARQVETLAIVPITSVIQFSLQGQHVVPLIDPAAWTWLNQLSWSPRMLVLDGWDQERYDALRHRFPDSIICVRVPMGTNLLEMVQYGPRVFHLTANYHGYVGDQFVMDLVLQAHQRLVDAGVREEITLVGGGGIVLAEHVPKAIICGLDAVSLDVALAVALQARFNGECIDRETASLSFLRLNTAWGVQRLKNLAASWQDQLLEILGAMGLREVRRLRGETGRCMFQKELEREVFGAEGSGT